MIKVSRTLASLLTAGLLAACGSRPVPQPATVVNARNAMQNGMTAYADNRYAEARTFFGKALAEYQSVDNRGAQAEALSDLADSALLQGDTAAAKSCLVQARAIAEQDKLTALLPRLTLLDSYADLQSGDPAAAAVKLDGLLDAAGTPADVKNAALFARSQAAFDLKAADANDWLGKLTAAVGGSSDDATRGRLERLQALAAIAAGDLPKAASLYADALARYQAAFYRPGIAATHEEWADLLISQQNWSDAALHLRRALGVRLWMYDASHSERILEKLQKADTALGNADAAKQDAELAAYLKDGGDPSKSPSAAHD